MIVGELIAMILGIGGLAAAAHMFDAWRRKASEDAVRSEKIRKQMQDDLRDALRSRDYNRLDDWLVMYADNITPEMRKNVESRRTELYISTK